MVYVFSELGTSSAYGAQVTAKIRLRNATNSKQQVLCGKLILEQLVETLPAFCVLWTLLTQAPPHFCCSTSVLLLTCSFIITDRLSHFSGWDDVVKQEIAQYTH